MRRGTNVCLARGLAPGQQATESEPRLALLISVKRRSQVPESDGLKATQVLRISAGLHLPVELRVEEEGDEPARKRHITQDLRASKSSSPIQP